jgi:hypothetical protein
VQDFERVTVEDGDDGAMILRDSDSRSGYQESEEHTPRGHTGKRRSGRKVNGIGASQNGVWEEGCELGRKGYRRGPVELRGKMVVCYRRHPFTGENMAEGARFETPDALETIGPHRTASVLSQSFTKPRGR